jgi:hypothetical protein
MTLGNEVAMTDATHSRTTRVECQRPQTFTQVCAVVLLAAVLGCGSAGADAIRRTAPVLSVTILSGNGQQAVAGTELPSALVVLVADTAGASVLAQPVSFRVTAGGGSVVPESAISNTHGEAHARWTLGPHPGEEQRLEARVLDNDVGQPVVIAVFVATALSPASQASGH